MSRRFPLSKEELYKLYWIDGLSLPEIGKMIGRDPSNVLRAMQRYGIPRRGVSEGLKNFYRKHKGANVHVRINMDKREEWAYFIGVYLGDGYACCVERLLSYRIYIYCGKDLDFANVVASCIREICNAKVNLRCTAFGYVVYFYSKKVYEVLKDWNKMKQFIEVSPEHFIRGLFDAEGYVMFCKDKRRKDSMRYQIIITNKNLELLTMVQRFLRQMGIKTSIIHNRAKDGREWYNLVTTNKEGFIEFVGRIGSSIKRKMDRMMEVVDYFRRKERERMCCVSDFP